jgi:hypothetical protein
MFYKRPQEKFTKKKAEQLHAQRRLEERFNLKNVSEAKRLIRLGISTPVFKESNRVVHHRIRLHGQDMIAVYDKRRNEIITFLPVEE